MARSSNRKSKRGEGRSQRQIETVSGFPNVKVRFEKPTRPDFETRLREFWGDRNFEVTGTELLSDQSRDT